MHYITGAFPSACGKTNLAMLVPPASMPGWKVWTVGDDIAWLRPGDDGRLWAVNPEAGFFGVVPGTSRKTNPNATQMIQKDTIYTNVALRPDGTPWWEGHDDPPPAEALDWQGRPWTPAVHDAGGASQQPLHRARLAVRDALAGIPEPRTACRSTRSSSARGGSGACRSCFRRAAGSTARFSARRSRRKRRRRPPARSACCAAIRWRCGRSAATTWATTSVTGSTIGKTLSKPPQIFRVNWFRTGENGKFLWPGFGDNLRVLKWILERCDGKGAATETIIGMVPSAGRASTSRGACHLKTWRRC